jgi:hypothetical protein
MVKQDKMAVQAVAVQDLDKIGLADQQHRDQAVQVLAMEIQGAPAIGQATATTAPQAEEEEQGVQAVAHQLEIQERLADLALVSALLVVPSVTAQAELEATVEIKDRQQWLVPTIQETAALEAITPLAHSQEDQEWS